MLTRQKHLNVCALLLGTSLIAFANVGYAAESKGPATVRKSPIKTTIPGKALKKLRVIRRPQIHVNSSANPKAKGASAVAAKPGALPHDAAVTRNVRGSGVNRSQVASRIDGRRLGELSALPQDKFNSVGQRVRSQLDSQVQGANSALLAGLDKVMPGFQTRGAHGPSSLKEVAATGGNHHNPLGGGVMDQFTGGGVGQDGKGGKGKVTDHPDGSTTIKNEDGSVTDVWKDGTIVTQNKDGTTEVNKPNGQTDRYGKDGRKLDRQIIDPDNKGFYTDGTKIADKKSGAKQGSKKEPTPDDGTSASSPKYVTGALLRGLAARFGANRTSTGEEGGSGGPLDNSKTRRGRVAQVGQPVDAQGDSTGVAIDNMQIKQLSRLRMRRIEVIND